MYGVQTANAQQVLTTLSLPHLLLQSTSGTQKFPLVKDTYWTIGRSKENGIVIQEPWISRNHALIQRLDNGEFYLIDLGSRNGSFVNGRRVNVPTFLKHHDRVTFGQSEILFCDPSEYRTDQQAQINSRRREDYSEPITDTLHERRLISVMVVDIRNFTILSRKLDNHILSSIMGTWFRQAGDIIKKSGSWVDKYIGDAVMSIWFHGEQTVETQHLMNVLQAVSELHQMTSDLQQQFALPFELAIGAGVNTGYAMVGNTGTGDRPDYTAIGDTVNAAFRLESSTKQMPEDIAIGADTFQYLQELPAVHNYFQERELSLKGYDQPFHAFCASYENLNYFLLHHLVATTRQPHN